MLMIRVQCCLSGCRLPAVLTHSHLEHIVMYWNICPFFFFKPLLNQHGESITTRITWQIHILVNRNHSWKWNQNFIKFELCPSPFYLSIVFPSFVSVCSYTSAPSYLFSFFPARSLRVMRLCSEQPIMPCSNESVEDTVVKAVMGINEVEMSCLI